MSRVQLGASASGLRPASAFLGIALVLGVVAGRLVWVSARADEGRLPRVHTVSDLPPAWSIHDRDGRPLATFVQRLDLVLSPNAMWQAHTPDALTRRISEVLGGTPGPAELLAAMMPDAEDGVVRASDPRTRTPLRFSREDALRVDAWARAASRDRAGRPLAIDGIWLEEREDGGWELCWAPALTLSEQMRARHMPARRKNPLAWSRFLADGLALCLLEDDALVPGTGVDDEELEEQREGIWRVLMPSTYTLAVRDFDAACGPALDRLLEEERVASHQMSVQRGRTRAYPSGRDELLGFWGFVDELEASRAALVRVGFPRSALRRAEDVERAAASLTAEQRRQWAAERAQLVAEPIPVSGLERASARLLAAPSWSFLEREPATFSFLQHRPAARRARPYFLASSEASETPRVVTTVDALLQRFVDRELERVMLTHAPALTMAIALDIETGAVLAVGARSPFAHSGWAPVHHRFLPGSTFKVPVMATALESGRVRPDDVFDVGQGDTFVWMGRSIHEAEHSKNGRLTAAECLAHSLNAGLVQIGARVSSEYLRAHLQALHYGEAPVTGLGGESAGHLPALPWDGKYRHASISFGYEMQVTLWQHAAALATIVRGGEWLPLRLLDAVEQGGRRYPLPAARGQRVFSAGTCAQVRAMMALGAAVGTGMRVAGPEQLPGLRVGSKTGTAEKVPGEVCLHRELADAVRHRESGTPCGAACRRALRAAGSVHARACKTLSMAIFGRRAESEREVFVLVVVDDPLEKGRYGSDTAGPAAVAILREALGLTSMGQPRGTDRYLAGFRLGPPPHVQSSEQPWAEVAE